jgi:succinate dehydrogenase/fumarate reductase flavoprotein subunit
MMGLFTRRKTVFVDSDILVIGGGMGGCGATYESRYWGRDLKIVCVEKANIERSGAVAQGLYAGAGTVVDDDLLAERFRHSLTD